MYRVLKTSRCSPPNAHNDLADLERALKKAGVARRLVVTDAVFSMDGDVADLPG
ncbi:aminotransferase class I/II-fold pyridoxal phosphate-dependent enzyme, partial [Streptomyces albidoflavus]|uniref:aminotransferase class I/II-fold pyridoxal phosphate-dependent enzyme n=1 Tax=Streptomyces albidoflavus TaxID=1886 RepID=UPI00117DD0D2